jgi:hypothetical protein
MTRRLQRKKNKKKYTSGAKEKEEVEHKADDIEEQLPLLENKSQRSGKHEVDDKNLV